jgi:4-carboxymuconolactone decarboxylase
MTPNEKSTAAASAGREVLYAILPDRMPPIPTEKMTDAQKKVAAAIAAGPRGKVEGPYWPIIRSPGLTEVLQEVGAYYRYRCPLERKINEMVALMAARSWSQQFVWDVHILQALDAGLKNEIALALAEGRRPAAMAEDEEIAYDFVTELLATKGASDPTYARTVAKFGEEGTIDIIGIVGYYSLLGMIMNVARTSLLEGRPFPLAPTPIRLQPLAGTPLRGR